MDAKISKENAASIFCLLRWQDSVPLKCLYFCTKLRRLTLHKAVDFSLSVFSFSISLELSRARLLAVTLWKAKRDERESGG